MNNPDTPDHPDTDPFSFEFTFGQNTLTIEARVFMDRIEIIECHLGGEEFDIYDIKMREFGKFEFVLLEELISIKAWEYLEDYRE